MVDNYWKTEKMCRDILFCTVFALIILMCYALRFGSPTRMVRGFDPDRIKDVFLFFI